MTNLKFENGLWTVDTSEPIPGEFIERRIRGKVHVCAKRRRIRQTFRTKTEALAALDLIRGRRAMRKAGFEPPAEDKDEGKAKDLSFGFYARRIAAAKTDLRPNSREALDRVMRALEPVFGEKLIRAITTDDISRRIASRGTTVRTAANEELRVIRMVMRRAVEEGLIDRNPAGPVKRLRVDSHRWRILTDAEADLLIAAANPTMAAFIKTLLVTGARPCEALAAHWAYEGWDTERKLEKAIVCPDRKILHVPQALAKTHKSREIPLSKELLTALKATSPIEPGRKIFPWIGDTPRSFETAVKAAKLKNVSPYACRHTAASRMLKAGVDIKTVSEILGHTNVLMTSRYCHSDPESKREAIRKLSAVYVKAEQPADGPAARDNARVEAQAHALEN
jgi:integrase